MGNDQCNVEDEPALHMNGGDGPYSYSQNSTIQKKGIESVKDLITEGILENLDTKRFVSSGSEIFSIADLGCAMGPNTFVAVQNIMDSVLLKFKSEAIDSNSIEFQVFFNDHVCNDFNTLFKSMPSDKKYFAAGVGASFHGRLFPKASLDVCHSSYALHWLSKVPQEILNRNSPAWNKGKVYYTNSPKQVVEAYRKQFREDMESFLKARVTELVPGGLMTLLIPTVPSNCKCVITTMFDLLGSALMDMASQGLVDEDKIDNMNLGVYMPTQDEITSLIESNGCFSIERIEPLFANEVINADVDTRIMHLRAGVEGNIKETFGGEMVEKVFDKFKEKIIETGILLDPTYKPSIFLFLFLKRKTM